MQLPSASDIERALLGVMIAEGAVRPEVTLAPDDFASERHRRIFMTMLELADKGDPCDLPTLVQALTVKGEIGKVGGASYVASLTDGIPSCVSINAWQKAILDFAIRRRLIKQADALMRLAQTENFDRLSLEVETLGDILQARTGEESIDTLEDIDREYEEFVRNLDQMSIRLGINELDDRTGGLQFGEVVTLIARTGVGKSAIAQNMISNVLRAYPKAGVVFVSLEMPRLQAFARQLQIHAGKKRSEVIEAYRSGNKCAVQADEFVANYRKRLAIIDKPGLTLDQIKRRVSALVKLKLLNPVRLLVIDYLGYLAGGPKDASLVERISEIARDVKQLAKELHVVVLLISQTSRNAGDGSEEVTITDARDSGAIEDSADFLIGCWRPELKTGITVDKFDQVEGDLWFKILKARRGVQDKFKVKFEGETLRVLDSAKGTMDAP